MSESHYTKDGLKKIGTLVAMKPDLLAAFMTFDGKVFEHGALPTKDGIAGTEVQRHRATDGQRDRTESFSCSVPLLL